MGIDEQKGNAFNFARVSTLFGKFPFLQKLFADGGYQGKQYRDAQKKALPNVATDIVKRSDAAQGFEVLPRRWVVGRTLAWLGRCRRLAKDWENINRNALAFLYLASIRLMVRKLCNPS
jgi:transposase